MEDFYCVCRRDPERLQQLFDECIRLGHSPHFEAGTAPESLFVSILDGEAFWRISTEDIDDLLAWAVETGQLEFRDNPIIERLLRGDDVMIVSVGFNTATFPLLVPLLETFMDDESDFISFQDGFKPIFRRHELRNRDVKP